MTATSQEKVGVDRVRPVLVVQRGKASREYLCKGWKRKIRIHQLYTGGVGEHLGQENRRGKGRMDTPLKAEEGLDTAPVQQGQGRATRPLES